MPGEPRCVGSEDSDGASSLLFGKERDGAVGRGTRSPKGRILRQKATELVCKLRGEMGRLTVRR